MEIRIIAAKIFELEELCKSQQVLIEVLDERLSHIELLLTQEDNK